MIDIYSLFDFLTVIGTGHWPSRRHGRRHGQKWSRVTTWSRLFNIKKITKKSWPSRDSWPFCPCLLVSEVGQGIQLDEEFFEKFFVYRVVYVHEGFFVYWHRLRRNSSSIFKKSPDFLKIDDRLKSPSIFFFRRSSMNSKNKVLKPRPRWPIHRLDDENRRSSIFLEKWKIEVKAQMTDLRLDDENSRSSISSRNVKRGIKSISTKFV